MKCAVTVFKAMQNLRLREFAATYHACYRKYCTTQEQNTEKIHPYRRIHPWKSEIEFTKDLLKNVIYNADGIVAINKPYGIPIIPTFKNNFNNVRSSHNIVEAVNYDVKNVLPHLIKELDVPEMIPCVGSEKYMTGIYIFGTNKKACEQIKRAQLRAIPLRKFRKFWAITIRVPNILKGQYHVAMKQKISPKGDRKPIIVTEWSNNAVKRQDIKILNVNYKLISNSTQNLSSLIEMDVSSKKWHAIRLFAATMLYAPLLGDNYHGSRVQEIMGTWIKVNPFTESINNMPTISSKLLELLNIKKNQQEIIPCHTHLRSIFLPSYGKEKKDLLIEAPLIHPFDWTCKQLMFKNIPYETDSSNTIDEKIEAACT